MKTLVTGGAGFIGSHLVESLLKDHHDVVVLDNYSIGETHNLIHVQESRNLKIYREDITDYESIRSHFVNIDWVFHLAGFGGIQRSKERPLEYHHYNVGGTINVLEASKEANVKRFVYANSASCYAAQRSFPILETADINLEHPYSLTKYIGEQYTLHWGMVYHLPVVCLRLFKTYGPRSPMSGYNKGIFGNFLEQKQAGKSLRIVGDGSQARDFVYVTDVARAFVAAARSNVKNEVFNIGSGKQNSLNYLAKLFGGAVERTSKTTTEPDCTQADITKAREILGWQPQVSLKEGVGWLLASINEQKDPELLHVNRI